LPDVTTPDGVQLDMHVVAHTHWDREWYHAAPRFRQRLVSLVRSLLAEARDSTRPFLLDGQAVVLEDVLDVHPEWEGALREQLCAGALEAGPWYVLADELMPSGEALVRNLAAGRRVLARFGATPPPVCYSPDSFGHPAMLPAIARGFGLRVAVLWRGYGSARWPSGDSARWIAPDGSELPLWHLPRDGYEYGGAGAVATAPRRARAAVHHRGRAAHERRGSSCAAAAA
jgi:alpha-mannosidase